MKVYVHPRVMERHPDLSEADVLSAWKNMLVHLPRLESEPTRYIAVGSDIHGRLMEMVAERVEKDCWIIFHAMSPPSRKTLIELRLMKR